MVASSYIYPKNLLNWQRYIPVIFYKVETIVGVTVYTIAFILKSFEVFTE